MFGSPQHKARILPRIFHFLGAIVLAQPVSSAAQNSPRIIDHRTIVDPKETLAVIIDGVRYTVPVNYFNTVIEQDDVLGQEVKSGFGIQGLYPDFAMRNQENRHHFSGEGSGPEIYRDVMIADVSRMCATTPGGCTPQRSWKTKKEIYRGTRFLDVVGFKQLGVKVAEVAEPSGLTLLGAANFLGKGDKLAENSWLAYSVDDAGDDAFMTCRIVMPHANSNPRCTYYGKLSGHTYVDISFSYRHIQNWQSIREVVLGKLREFAQN